LGLELGRRAKLLLLTRLFPGDELLLLLRGKLLLRSKLLLRGKLLLLLGSKLLLRGKLLLLSGGKLLLLSGGKLLLLSGGKLLLLLLRGKLLLLLELSKVLFEGVRVELGGQVLLGVEVGSVEHRSPGSLSLVGKGLSLGVAQQLFLDLLLLLNHSLLVGQDRLVSGLLSEEGGVLCHGLGVNRLDGLGTLGQLGVGGETGAVVGGVLHNNNLALLVQVPVFAFNISLGVSGFHLEGAISRLVPYGVAAVLVDFVDLFDDDGPGLGGGGGGCHGGRLSLLRVAALGG